MRGFPDGIEARRARPGDLERVQEFVFAGIRSYRSWAPAWEPSRPSPEAQERLTRVFADDSVSWVLIAEAEGRIAGVVALSTATGADAREPAPGTVYLWQMFVRPDWQGSGLAGALLDRVLAEARARGYTRMTLWAAAGAAQARRFYEREGFTLTGEETPDSFFGLPLVQYGRPL